MTMTRKLNSGGGSVPRARNVRCGLEPLTVAMVETGDVPSSGVDEVSALVEHVQGSFRPVARETLKPRAQRQQRPLVVAGGEASSEQTKHVEVSRERERFVAPVDALQVRGLRVVDDAEAVAERRATNGAGRRRRRRHR